MMRAPATLDESCARMRTRFARARARQRSDLYGAKPRPERYERREGRSWNGNSLRGASNMSVCGTVRWENAATWQNSIAVKIACRTCRALCASCVVGECVKNKCRCLIPPFLPSPAHAYAHTHVDTHTDFLGLVRRIRPRIIASPSSSSSPYPVVGNAARNCFRWVRDASILSYITRRLANCRSSFAGIRKIPADQSSLARRPAFLPFMPSTCEQDIIFTRYSSPLFPLSQ